MNNLIHFSLFFSNNLDAYTYINELKTLKNKLGVITHSERNVDTVLRIPVIEGKDAVSLSNAVHKLIKDNKLENRVVELMTDNEPNKGHCGGACFLIEEKLKRKLLQFSCRHHIFEISR